MEIQEPIEPDFNKMKLFFDNVREAYSVNIKSEDIDIPITVEDFNKYNSNFSALYEKDFKNGCEINVWEISGIKRDEVKNCAILAWWLDHNETHGLGASLLKKVISDHLTKYINSDRISNNYRCGVEMLPLGMIEDRIDIEIVGQDFLLFWEVKIDAPEGYRQLERYCSLLDKKSSENMEKAVIYLTPYNVPLKDRINEDKICYLTWDNIRGSFLSVYSDLNGEDLNSSLLKQYCDFIGGF